MRCYAIGDVHGHLEKLEDIHRRIVEDRAATGDLDAPVYHLGDYVDRGPDAPGVIEYLATGKARGAPWVLLRGNHDAMMLSYLTDPQAAAAHWLSNNIGGSETLAGYGIDVWSARTRTDIRQEARRRVPNRHVEFLTGLQNAVHVPGLFFCHAGIRPGLALTQQKEEDLLWIRRPFHDDTRDHGALIVHGHTPVREVTHYGNRLNLDTGAGYGKALSAVVIEGTQVFQLAENGRRPVIPIRR